jgi:predicted phosphodiesterase
MSHTMDRRQFLAATSICAGAWTLGAAGVRESLATPTEETEVSFFLVSDTHFLAQKEAPTKLDETSLATCRGLVETLNRLPGTAIPVETEWAAFADEFGLTGQDARLKYPIYEVHGNHDSPPGTGLPVQKIIERNKTRPGLKNVSENGLHYSWDWGPMHFINLGIVVGSDPALKRPGRYNPLDSLGFLMSDLAKHVGATGRPVIITHHVDLARYSKPCDLDAKPSGGEWDSCDVLAYHAAIKPFNVVAILYGHTHTRNVFRWDGVSPKADSGIQVFNVDNGAHFSSGAQAFF